MNSKAIIAIIGLVLAVQVVSTPISMDLTKSKGKRKAIRSSRLLASQNVNLKYNTGKEEFYTVRLGLGNPVQYFDVQVDTTSSISWVPSSHSELGNSQSGKTGNSTKVAVTYETKTNKTNSSSDFNKTYNYSIGNKNDSNNQDDSNSTKYEASVTVSPSNDITPDGRNTYYQSRSSSARTTNKTVKIENEDGDVKGTWTYDNVQLGSLKANDYAFVQAVKYDKDFSDYDGGKLGLGYHSKHGEKFSLLHTLKDAGVISKKIFSISASNNTGAALHIGDYPIGSYFSLKGYSSCNLTSSDGLDDEYEDGWICDISHVFLGEHQNISESIKVDGRVMFDSSLRYIRAPEKFLKMAKSYIIANNITGCSDKKYDDGRVLSCDSSNDFSKLGDISFLLSGWVYTIPAKNLFQRSDDNRSDFLIRFEGDKNNFWVFGLAFFNEFTVIFNAEDKHVGFSGGKRQDFTSQWTAWVASDAAADEANRNFYMIVGATILGSVLLITIVFLVVHSIKRRRLEEHGPLINERN